MTFLLGLFLIYLSFALGNGAMRFAGPKTLDPDERLVYGTALGLGLIAYLILLLGIFHLLTEKTIILFLAAILIVTLISVKQNWNTFCAALSLWKFPLNFWNLTIVVFGLLALVPALVAVGAPETANDSLCYHLHVPKLFLKNHVIEAIPFEVNSLFPFLMEMLFTIGLAFKSVTLAKFLHLIFGALGFGALLMAARRYGKIEYGWWAGLVFLSTPGVVNQLATTYIDVALACLNFLSILAFIRWKQSENNRWLVLSGVLMGLTLSVKYLALISLTALIVIMWGNGLAQRKKISKIFKETVVFLLPVFVFSAYWYIRSYVELGNPVYPYFYSLFGAGDPTIHYDDIGLSKSLLNLFLVPWVMSVNPEVFEGFGDQIGPFYLAFLPWVFWALKGKAAKSLGIFCLIYFFFWFFLGQSLRFFYPVLPVLTLLIAKGFSTHSETIKRHWGIPLLLVLVLLLHAGMSWYHYRDAYAVALGRESHEDYLLRNEKSFAPAQWVNQNLSTDAKIINLDEARMFYFNREIVREIVYAFRTEYHLKSKTPFEVAAGLKKDGFTHLLVTQDHYWEARKNLHPNRLPRLLYEGDNSLALSIELLYTYEFRHPDGEETIYRIYRL